MHSRISEGFPSSWKEKEKTLDFSFLLLPEGPRDLGPGTEAGGGVCRDGSLQRGVALVKSPACLIWRRVARGKKEKSRGVRVERSSHLPPPFPRIHKTPFINSFVSGKARVAARPLPRCLQPRLMGPHIHPMPGGGAWTRLALELPKVSFLGPKLRCGASKR